MKKLVAILLTACALIALSGCEEPRDPNYRLGGPLAAVRVVDEAGEIINETFTEPEILAALGELLDGAEPLFSRPEGPVHFLEVNNGEQIDRLMVTLGETAVFDNLGQAYALDKAVYLAWLNSLGEEHYLWRDYPEAALKTPEGPFLLTPLRATYEYLRLDGSYASPAPPVPAESPLLAGWEGESLPLPEVNPAPGHTRLRVICGGEEYEDLESLGALLPGALYLVEYTVSYGGGSYRGDVTYDYAVETAVPPVSLEVTGNVTDPGEAVVLRVKNLPEGETITCDTSIPFVPTFYPDGEGSWTALLPVSYYVLPGEYYVSLSAAGVTEEFPITVRNKEFEVQELTVDAETTAQTIASAEANAEYNRIFWPLQFIVDEERYWEGKFIRPVEGGEISTPFAVKRYTNGSTTATRHGAIDISLDEGTPICAPNRGRVQYAGYLALTGNTIMIEHGFGLKTWYFHMSALEVETGAMVEQGQKIGEVGTTGFSTGPHLHYGMSVREIMINPDTAELTGLFAFA